MSSKKNARLRRARKIRINIKRLDKYRLSVHRTPRHIYAQILSSDGSVVLQSASSLDKEIRDIDVSGGNVRTAALVGKIIARRAVAAGLAKNIAFDRSGYKYHGRIKALADAAREGGIDF